VKSGLEESVEVGRVLIDVRAVDGSGQALEGLVAEDFEVLIDGVPADVLSVDWFPAGPASSEIIADESPPPAAGETPVDPIVEESERPYGGRLIVFLFQRYLHKLRTPGIMRMAAHARRIVEELPPGDRVAILGHDSRLELLIDFTDDRNALFEVLENAVVVLHRPEPLPPGPAPSLARHLDFDAARDAANPEAGLLAIGEALQELRGPKSLFFFAWGMGRMTGSGTHMNPEYDPARVALVSARTSVYTFDTTDADWHSLEGTLMKVSEDTGGVYQKTHLFAEQAVKRVQRMLSGHYVLSVARPDYPTKRHVVEVSLTRKKGQLFARTFYDDD
jgi:VWFA-related protein